MKKIKIKLMSFFLGFIFLNLLFINSTVTADEVPDDTYYCWYSVGSGVGFIRVCYACNIFPFASPNGYDGMCTTEKLVP